MDELRKNQELECTVEGCTSEGLGVARVSGRAVFVKDALPGESCRIQILKVSRAAVYARVLQRFSDSPCRVRPDCPHYGRCGGCDWRHVSYEGELSFKLQRVNDAFQRIGGLDLRAEEILPAPRTGRYRAKAIFAVAEQDGRAVTGFYRARSHAVIPVEDCPLQTEEANLAAAALRCWMDACRVPAWDEEAGRGLIRHLFVRSGMVCVVAAGEPVHEKELIEAFRAALPELRSLIWNKNTKTGNTVLAGEFRTLWGADTVEVTLSGLRFRLSPRSFFQVNPPQAEKLYALAVSFAALEGSETVVDLYCGTGAIGLLAAPKAKEVVGVEVVAAAVEDAREAAARNGIGNARFLCADAAEAAAQFAARGMQPDVLFVDPPRKGLDASVIDSVAAMSPSRVVYVSCDPATLARDLRRFADLGYAAEKAIAVDMFPRTRHVETVCLLSKLHEAKHHVNVKLDMDELDLTSAEAKATYKEIEEWVQEHYGFHVTNLNIAQVKQKHGIIERENYNKPKSEGSRQPGCPEEKVKAIEDALRHFQMI